MNTLYHGDNLDVRRPHIKDESVDLVYLDPPLNIRRSRDSGDEVGVANHIWSIEEILGLIN
jgi:DNA modification methylase